MAGVPALALLDVGTDQALAFAILIQAVWYVPTLLVGGLLVLRCGLGASRHPAAGGPSHLASRRHEPDVDLAAPRVLFEPIVTRALALRAGDGHRRKDPWLRDENCITRCMTHA